MLVFRWQKVENELLKGVRKEGKCLRKQRKRGFLGSSLEVFYATAKRLRQIRTEIVQFDLVTSCQLLALE